MNPKPLPWFSTMLVFKRNIYFIPLSFSHPSQGREYRDEEDPTPLAFNFIDRALANAQTLFREIGENPDTETTRRLAILFPHASRWGKTRDLKRLSEQLETGLRDRQVWWVMNCYHQCFLFDCLLDSVEDYSYALESERRDLIPELKGRELDFNRFLAEYFFNTVFLMAPERFDQLSPEERKGLGKTPFSGESPQSFPIQEEDPTLTRVIHCLQPGPEDLSLKALEECPYIK